MDRRVSELARIRVRIAELQTRARELVERSRELTAPCEPAGPGNVRRAQQRAELARVRSDEARGRVVRAYLRAAQAHAAAAARYETLADGGVGDVVEHRRRAREHRLLSESDRRQSDSECTLLPDGQ